jgi:ADP-ribosyl-[dinitrogen reductase] hydrolase
VRDVNLFQGALVGLACGDAIGTTLEFKPRGSFLPVTDMVGWRAV